MGATRIGIFGGLEERRFFDRREEKHKGIGEESNCNQGCLGQSFELGFFSPGKSENRCLGIWYKSTPETVVWVANRDDPIAECYRVLTIKSSREYSCTAPRYWKPTSQGWHSREFSELFMAEL